LPGGRKPVINERLAAPRMVASHGGLAELQSQCQGGEALDFIDGLTSALMKAMQAPWTCPRQYVTALLKALKHVSRVGRAMRAAANLAVRIVTS